MKELELLAPAGSYDGLVAVINAGADAVYIGGQKFSARAYAENPEKTQLIDGIDYAHLRGKKVYLTVNTLLKNSELKELYDYLKAPYEAGLDAVIVQDLGVLQFIHKQFPHMDIHASTQMSVTGLGGFEWLKKLGVTRVVPARELSLKELAYIHRNSSLEIEAFIHGALCYCYSGQCLLSSLIGGRSGNRGRCAQPCRLPYAVTSGDCKHTGNNNHKPEFVLSPKDLCTIDYMPQLMEAGVTSFKIEGRMKRPEYAAGVVEIYRKAMDGKPITKEDRTQLLNLYSRSGNCTGYLENHNGKSMITLNSPSYRTGEDTLFDRINKDYLQRKNSLTIQGKCSLKYGKPAVLELSYKDFSIQVLGDCPDHAKNQPLEADAMKKRLSKTGETDFVFTNLEIDLEDGLFMSMQSLNSLRRNGLEQLKEEILAKSRRLAFAKNELPFQKANKSQTKPALNVLVTSLAQAEVLLDFPEVKDVYIDTVSFSIKRDLTPYQNALVALKHAGKRVFLALPYIFRQNSREAFKKHFNKIFLPELDGCLVRNWETYVFLQEELKAHPECKLTLRSDSNLYCFNSLSKEVLLEQNFEKITLPVELNQKELLPLADETCEWIVYSYLPLMISAQCVQNTTGKCTGQPGLLKLKDRLKKDFTVRNYCDCCYNMIYNGTPMILWDKEISTGSYRLDFHLESPETVREILKDAISSMDTKKPPKGTFTRGHFTRGVE